MRRREVLGLAAFATATLRSASASPAIPPPLCVFSKALAKVGYPDLGDIAKQIGFDGVDLAVLPGGHVEPRLANVDLVRAWESITGVGLECPIITTALTSPMDPAAFAVIAIAGRTGIPLFRVGEWRESLVAYKREINGLIAIGSRYEIAMALHNYTSENEGETDWAVAATLASLNPKWAGAYFDPIHHGSKWEAVLRQLLPRLRAVAVKDFRLVDQRARPCPLGQGELDMGRLFHLLADAGYTGPLSLHLAYAASDELDALTKDCQFARKQLEAAYVRIGSGSGAGSGSGIG